MKFSKLIWLFRAWKFSSENGNIKAEHVILHNLIRGKPAKLGFTAITNEVKIANGQAEFYGYELALIEIQMMRGHAQDYLNYIDPDFLIDEYNKHGKKRYKRKSLFLQISHGYAEYCKNSIVRFLQPFQNNSLNNLERYYSHRGIGINLTIEDFLELTECLEDK